MKNNLGGKNNCTIHFHGMYQNGTTHMDGAPGVSQCPVVPGQTFTYNFTVNQNGTYWYHTHVDAQYPDGYRGAFIVHDKDAYFEDQYDEELVVTLSDWYHDLIEDMKPDFMNLYNPSGAEPVPQSMLFNESQHSSISVKPNTTYLLRLINIGAFSSQFFYIEDHDFEIVEVDGVYVEPAKTDMLYITAAQRYAVLLKTKDTTDKNYPIVTIFDSTLFDVITPDLTLNQTNWLEYDKNKDHPEGKITVESSEDLEAFDDFDLVPYDHIPLYPEPDQRIELNVEMTNLMDGVSYAFFNNITYTAPKVPSLLTALSAGELANDSRVYSEYTNPFVLNHMDVVEIVVNNHDPGVHPFHMHGHEFQVVERSPAFDDDDNPVDFDPKNPGKQNKYPMRRDTSFVRPNGYSVYRFVADNPGVWFFHCHIEWHMMQGLAIQMIEAPTELQKQLGGKLPQNYLDTCKAANFQTEGNAAGNTKDFLDLSGENMQAPSLPAGFTARGIVAMVFSCVSAFLGMAAIAWYGMADLSKNDNALGAYETGEQYRDDDDSYGTRTNNDSNDHEPTR